MRESELRKKMIEAALVDVVIGLGKKLFYNSSMESCLLVCRMKKPKERKGKIVFINAVNEIKLERSSAYLEDSHILKIASTYKGFKDIDGFAKIVSIKDVLNNNGLLTVFMYIMHSNGSSENHNLKELFEEIKSGIKNYQKSVKVLFDKLNSIGIETGND